MREFLGRIGSAGLSFLLFPALVSSCNPNEEYMMKEYLMGADAYCSEATDVNSCQALGDKCQPAYQDSVGDVEEPVYEACVANPDAWINYWSGNNTGGSGDGSGDGSGSTGGSTGGSGTGNGNGNGNGNGSGGNQATVPTIQDAYRNNCQNLGEQYYFVKQIVERKNKKERVSQVTKVKVCHMSGNSRSHTIVIACPALKAHIRHDDYLGACEL